MRKFDEWSEAEEWAQETDRSLEPTGTYTGDERILCEETHGDTHVEMWERVAEVLATHDTYAPTMLNVTEYIVVTTNGDHKEITYANDWQDALDTYNNLTKPHHAPLPTNNTTTDKVTA